MTRRKMKHIGKLSLVILGIAGLLVVLGFVNQHRQSTVCWKFEVDIDRGEGYYFVEEEDVRKAVLGLGDSIIGSAMESLNTERIREAVSKMPAVRRADVYKSVDGRLQVFVKQCQPLGRVINQDGSSFYLDLDGGTVPLSNRFTAKVPVVTGMLKEPVGLNVHALRLNEELAAGSKLDEIFDLLMTIRKHEFMSAQLDHIYVDTYGEFVLIPRVGNHRILLGKNDKLHQKFSKLMAFYEQNLTQRDLNQYTEIDLRFRNQVIGRKRY